MSSTVTSNLQLEANNLNYIAMMFVRCYCFVIMPLGIVGHLMSIYVFTRHSLRSNPCSKYFFAATIVGLLNTCYTLPMRMIQSGFVDTDPGIHSIIFCKLTWFAAYSIRGLCPWLIVMACADRYLSSCTSMTIRSWSSIPVANRSIPFIVLISFIIYIHVPIFFRIDIIPATQKSICYPPGPPGTYRIILSFFNLVYFGLSPSLCMFLFGMLTFRNIVRSKRIAASRASNLENATTQNKRKTNRQMIRMLFVQVLVYCITALTYSIATIISSINASQPKNVFQVAQESLITAVLGMITNTGPCLSFYLFTLSSGLFRRELKKLFQKMTGILPSSQQAQTQTLNTANVRTIAMTTKV